MEYALTASEWGIIWWGLGFELVTAGIVYLIHRAVTIDQIRQRQLVDEALRAEQSAAQSEHQRPAA